MAQTALKPWTLPEFFAWQERQGDRYEVVGGIPLRMMAGASDRHDAIVLNLLLALGNRLRGARSTPFTGTVPFRRGPARSGDPENLTSAVELPSLGLSLPLAEIYEGMKLPPQPVIRTLPNAPD